MPVLLRLKNFKTMGSRHKRELENTRTLIQNRMFSVTQPCLPRIHSDKAQGKPGY